MVRPNVLWLVLLSAICQTLAIASADDFAPPPWDRTSPFAITAEWEFHGPPPLNPTPPDGFPLTNVFVKGSGSVATSALIFGTPAPGWGFGVLGDGWFFPPGPGPSGIRFTVDNVIDFMPVKHLWMQVTHTPGMELAVDTLAAFNFAATGSTPGPVSKIVHGPIYTIFRWDMFPNPPWEEFVLRVGSPGEVNQVVIDTISTGIPEPSTFVVYGIVLLSLGLAVRAGPKACKQLLG